MLRLAADENQSTLTTMKRVIALIKDHPVIAVEAVIAVAAIAAVFIAIQANDINQKGVIIAELEASRSPQIIYFISQISERSDEVAIEAAQRELENIVFKAVLARISKHPEESYSEALDSTLPISVPVTFSPSGVSIRVTNVGTSTATKVRITVELESEIGEVRPDTSELYNIVRGGSGEKQVTIEIDRLTPNTSADVNVILQGTGGRSEALLVAEKSSNTVEFFPDAFSVLAFEKMTGDNFSEYPRYPVQSIISTENREVQGRTFIGTLVTFALYRPIIVSPIVTVTSNEVTGEQAK